MLNSCCSHSALKQKYTQLLTLPPAPCSKVFEGFLHLHALISADGSPPAPPHLGQSLTGSSIHLPLNKNEQRG